MDKKLKNIQKSFIVSIVGLVILSVLSLGTVLYATNAIDLRQDVTSSHLHSLTQNFPAVEAYLQTQKHAEPHFIKIANLVKNDQQALLGRALLFTGVPILIFSVLLAYFLARKLVRPVEQTFADHERFLQDASHEMRNPLAALYAVVQDAKADNTPAAKDKALNTIERQVKQLVKLNEDLLLIERSKTNHKKASRNNLSDLLLDVIDSELSSANKQGVTIKTNIQPGIHSIIADNDWVCVTRNLIDNAIKYSDSKKSITVSLGLHNKIITLSVKDKGIGIPMEQLDKIGERFYRATNVGRATGTGLGMAIVQQIVSSNNGTIHIESKQNRGTTTTVKLPFKK
jgi:signal transduction histidine kinase